MSYIGYDENRVINALQIRNEKTNNVVYEYGTIIKTLEPEKASKAQIGTIESICKAHKIDPDMLYSSNNLSKATLTAEQRSRDANAYYWALCAKLAKVVGASNPEIHNKMLRLYGQPYLVDGYALYTPVPNTEEAIRQVDNSEEYHLIATTEVRSGKGGVDYRTYKMLRGSHTYNTEEMSRLIDGLIAECRNAGIPDAEIASPEEKRLLKERYGVDLG